jgi:SAM-dependent methyltransferase
MSRDEVMTIVEGFYASHCVWALHQLGVLPRLETPAGVSALAEEFQLDEDGLAAVLDYVHRTTGLLEGASVGYRLAPAAMPYDVTAFHLEKFVGAYGPPVTRAAQVLQDPSAGPALRDFDALARAFGRLQPQTPSLTAQVLRAWEVTSLLDLGCGAATLLVELAEADPEFRGWGVDASEDMVRTAKERIRRAQLDGRVDVLCGDVGLPATLPTVPESERLKALYGRSIMNEFFAGGGRGAVRVLAGLMARFPGRLLFLEDYYGRLTHVGSDDPEHRHGHALAQDLAQALTGQGVPPPDLAGWAAVYESAGCALLKAYEGDNNGIAWFIHVLRL